MDNSSECIWAENMTHCFSNITTTASTRSLLEAKLGPQNKNVIYVIFLLMIYGLIFISGTVGNICTCLVILKNNSLRTTTNYYLLSLALSDVLILLLGLPPEAYSIYEEYPWRFGYVFCIIKALFAEMTSYASVLTITAFTVERYIAICHPLKAHKIATYSRCIKIIISIWLISLVCSLPYPIHTDLFYYVYDEQNKPVLDSLICNIPNHYYERMMHVFQISTFIFFVFPLTVLIVLYSLIGLSLRRAELRRAASDECHHSNYSHKHGGNVSPSNFRHRLSSHSGHVDGSPTSMPRKVVLKVLVAVVAAFFICWAPFHAQRLLTVYNRNWTPVLLQVQSSLFYISGVLYFIGSTVNPILYNVMSRRFRRAFMETICHIPYKSNRESQRHHSKKPLRARESQLPLVERYSNSNYKSYTSTKTHSLSKSENQVENKEQMNGTHTFNGSLNINVSHPQAVRINSQKNHTRKETNHGAYKPVRFQTESSYNTVIIGENQTLNTGVYV